MTDPTDTSVEDADSVVTAAANALRDVMQSVADGARVGAPEILAASCAMREVMEPRIREQVAREIAEYIMGPSEILLDSSTCWYLAETIRAKYGLPAADR